MPRPAEIDGIHLFYGRVNAGLTPLTEDLMYLFMLSQEPEGFRLDQNLTCQLMLERAASAAPQIQALMKHVTDSSELVAKPLEVVFLEGPWHRGRTVLLGDAVHASTPHLAQGAGMAIEDAVVLAEELAATSDLEEAFNGYWNRRYERCRFVNLNSLAIGDMQMGKGEPVDAGEINRQCAALVATPI